MRLWRRASGVLKDQNSLWIASLSRKTALRNPDIEAAVIKSTSHDECSLDVHNADRVFRWLRLSPSNIKPLLWSISTRLEKTRSWVVALKGLILMHGVICCRGQAVQKIGRLPFDLSNFKDGHSNPSKTWGLNAFIRAYYVFLDQKSTVLFQMLEERGGRTRDHVMDEQGLDIMHELSMLQKMQGLLDLLMQIKPHSEVARVTLVLEAMDGIIIEIFDVYSRICRGIAIVLMNIYSAGKAEAQIALNVVKKATFQSDELAFYFEFCQDIGVANASDFPSVEKVPEEGIQELEQIIDVFSGKSTMDQIITGKKEDKAIVVRDVDQKEDSVNGFRTIITDKWEKFDEDLRPVNKHTSEPNNPFAASLVSPNLSDVQRKIHDLPDLISF